MTYKKTVLIKFRLYSKATIFNKNHQNKLTFQKYVLAQDLLETLYMDVSCSHLIQLRLRFDRTNILMSCVLIVLLNIICENCKRINHHLIYTIPEPYGHFPLLSRNVRKGRSENVQAHTFCAQRKFQHEQRDWVNLTFYG